MFIILLNYNVPLSQVDQYMIPHREFLHAQYAAGKLLASGPMVPRTGGVILANLDDREEVELMIRNDPFYQEKIAEYNIIEFNTNLYDPRVKDILLIR